MEKEERSQAETEMEKRTAKRERKKQKRMSKSGKQVFEIERIKKEKEEA